MLFQGDDIGTRHDAHLETWDKCRVDDDDDDQDDFDELVFQAIEVSPHTVQSDTTRCGVSRVGHAAKRPR
jgi:hypothetical protein